MDHRQSYRYSRNESTGDVRTLITAEEIYPAMERAFLSARNEIWAGYRVFDLRTDLRSDAGKAVGETWFDLVQDTLSRGVRLNLVLSDFDPIMAPDLHRGTWRSICQFLAAAECSNRPDLLNVKAAVHPARVGLPHRLLFWPAVWRRLRDVADTLNALPEAQRHSELKYSSGLYRHLVRTKTGALRPKRWPPADLIPATHHQKIAVFDRETLCVGGLDLDERRYDDRNHERRRDKTWHDVQLIVRDDPAVEEAQRHMECFLDATAGLCVPPLTNRLLVTLSRRRHPPSSFLGPKPLRRDVAHAHRRHLSAARDFIYLETQYFRDPAISRALARAGRDCPTLHLVMVLPGAPEAIAFDGARSMDVRYGEYLQAKAVERVKNAFGDRALFCSPVRPEVLEGGGRDSLAGSPIVYVHAKVSIFDDGAAILSSANLNSRSMSWDTEAGLELTDVASVRQLRSRVLNHWLGEDTPGAFLSGFETVARLQEIIRENLEVRPEKRRGFLVPYDPTPGKRFGKPAPGIPPEMV